MAWELHEQGVSNTRIAKQLGKHRETIGLWVGGIKEQGLEGFLNHYEQAKKGPRKARQIDLVVKCIIQRIREAYASRIRPKYVVKRLVWQIREREHDCCDQRECPWCGQKITYFLKEEHDIKLSVPKIYEILAEKYQIRSKCKKNQKRGAVPEAAHAREVVQVADATSSKMDSVMFGGIYAFTAVDTFSRKADVLLAPALTASEGYRFLQQSMSRRFDGHVRLIQTDGGPEFKEDFKTHVLDYCERHRIARPYKKNEQSYIESFNKQA